MWRRLVYVSTVTVAHLPSTVEDILLVSVANNKRDGVTGFLVCDGVHFAQALEGDEALVEACLERIRADSRNRGLTVRDRCAGPTRLFPRWSMCALCLTENDDALLSSVDMPADLAALTPDELWRRLTDLAERCRDELDAEHDRLVARLN